MEKDAAPALLAGALEAVAAVRRSYSARFNEILSRESANPHAVGKILSRREQEVLTHVLAGRSSREIGDLLGLSARTVEFHQANLMAKLGATNVTELLARAQQRGLHA